MVNFLYYVNKKLTKNVQAWSVKYFFRKLWFIHKKFGYTFDVSKNVGSIKLISCVFDNFDLFFIYLLFTIAYCLVNKFTAYKMLSQVSKLKTTVLWFIVKQSNCL